MCAIGFGLLAWLSDGALPTSLGDSPVVVDPAWDAPRRAALAAFCVLVAARAAGPPRPAGAGGLRRSGRRSPPAVATLVFGALAWGGGSHRHASSLLVQLAVVSGGDRRRLRGDDPRPLVPRHAQAARGAAHPARPGPARRHRRPGRPVRAWIATGAGPADVAPFAALVGPWALFVWLRLIVGLVFPLVVSWASVQTARTRSMESATGLLYINVGSIAAGTILAAGLYFGAGLLV